MLHQSGGKETNVAQKLCEQQEEQAEAEERMLFMIQLARMHSELSE